MFNEIYQYFLNVVFGSTGGNPILVSNISIFGTTLQFRTYLASVCAIVSELVIVVLCCLFVYRLVRLVGRLFSGGTL